MKALLDKLGGKQAVGRPRKTWRRTEDEGRRQAGWKDWNSVRERSPERQTGMEKECCGLLAKRETMMMMMMMMIMINDDDGDDEVLGTDH